MTAEIAILNKEAVALAADSAATSGIGMNPKIFASANKLFALSKYAPVGMMIFGGAHYMNIPWETIIKEYRRKLNDKRFGTLSEYANDFLQFLDNDNDFIPMEIQDGFFKYHVKSFFQMIKNEINENFDQVLMEKEEIKHEEVVQIVRDTIKVIAEHMSNADDLSYLGKDFSKKLKGRYADDVKSIKDEVFENLPMKAIEKKRLNEIAYNLFTKSLPHGINRKGTSGIVIAGFGDRDLFPALQMYHIDGYINQRLIYNNKYKFNIDFKQTALVVPFAQQEMVNTFMEGINPDFQRLIFGSLREVFRKYTEVIVEKLKITKSKNKKSLEKKLIDASVKLTDSLIEKFHEFKQKEFSSPVVEVVSVLPKDELASMAESLVNLTSLKRRVSSDLETVGGPIDVAVISKSDGFVWIRRKRYFNKDINPRFFANYNRR